MLNEKMKFNLRLLDVLSLNLGVDNSNEFSKLVELRNRKDEKDNLDVAKRLLDMPVPSPSDDSCDNGWDEFNAFVPNAMFKSSLILLSLGHEDAARELHQAMRMYNIEKNGRETIITESVRDKYRKAASVPRNKYYNEIVSVIECSWKKYPAGSKKELIRRLIAHYGEEHVSEDSLRRWIKESGLQPPRPKKFERILLVFPEKNA